MKQAGLIWLGLLILVQSSYAAPCYVVVEKHEEVSVELVEKLSGTMINAYLKPIKTIPNDGIPDDACHYSVSISRSNQTLVAGIGGEGHGFGYSPEKGVPGVTQALASAIYKMVKKSGAKKQMCRDYSKELEKECGEKNKTSVFKYDGKMAFRTLRSADAQSSPVPVDHPARVKMIRLPHKLERQIGFLLGRGNYQAVIQNINEVLEEMPDHPVLYFLKGKANEGMGNRKNAKKDFSKACELELRQACHKLKRDYPGVEYVEIKHSGHHERGSGASHNFHRKDLRPGAPHHGRHPKPRSENFRR